MPIIGVKKSIIDKHFAKVYTEEEFSELLFNYGLELDEVTCEKDTIEKEKGTVKKESDLSEEEVYKIELPANRYDLLSVEGLARALRIFLEEISAPIFKSISTKQKQRLMVRRNVAEIRPYVVAAVLRDVEINSDFYTSFIDLQDKLHQNICRKRALVAIGTHDLDTVEGPFVYDAEYPKDIRFRPLNQSKEYSAEELMVLYSTDSHLKPYLPIIAGKERFPVIRDRNGIVLSMPPIINGDHSKIQFSSRNIFIEATATDLEKAKIVLDTIVTLFSQYCHQPFTCEAVEVEFADGTIKEYPTLEYRNQIVDVGTVNQRIGLNLKAEEMANLLSRMSLLTKVSSVNESEVEVTIPPTRPDILHECDIAEDVAIAYGYNRISQSFPQAHTIAEPFKLNQLSDLLRYDIAATGWTETLNFALCSRDDISIKLRKSMGTNDAVKISNPKTSEFQVARTTLLPGLLKTLASNKDMSLPLRLFELQDIVLKSASSDVGARNERHLAALYCGKTSGFEIMHGFLDRIMQLLGVKWTNNSSGYHIKSHEDATFLQGRSAKVFGPGNIDLGSVGVLHPDVISAFGLIFPISVLEINIEPFL